MILIVPGLLITTSSSTVSLLVASVKFKTPATVDVTAPMFNFPQAALYEVGMLTVLAVEPSPINTISPDTGTEAPDPPPDDVDQVEVVFQFPFATAYLKLPTIIFPNT